MFAVYLIRSTHKILTSSELNTLVADISTFSILLPLSCALFYFSQADKAVRLFSVSIFVSFITEIISFYLSKKSINNLPGLHIYTIIEFTFYMLFYYQLFRSGRARLLIKVLVISFVLFAILFAFVFTDLWHFNTLSRSIEAFVLTFFGLAFFYYTLKGENTLRLEKHPYFWLNSGLLLYFMGNIFLFMVYNILLNETKEVFNSYWSMHSMFNISANILFSIGFACSKQVLK